MHRAFSVLALSLALALTVQSDAIATSASATDAAPQAGASLAFVGGRVYTSPSERPLADAVVLVANGRITRVGTKAQVRIPEGARVIDCHALTLTAGFWNSHVHFMEPKWKASATLPPAVLTAQLQEMLTRYGFVRVFETAALDREATFALRRRIASGEVAGPTIYTTGEPFVPPDGTPAYLAPLKIKLPEVATRTDAERLVRAQIAAGADGIKFWTASPVSMSKVVLMPTDVARHAIEVAHSLHKPVFAHPTNTSGAWLAARTGIDVLAHPSPDGLEKWEEGLVQALKASNTALIPTLKLYQWDPARQGATPAMVERVVNTSVEQVRQYASAGGTILFGTDVGYVTDYDPAAEYVLMHKAGLSFQQILASLTTAPAAKFGVAQHTGRIVPGMDADLVILAADPADGVEAFTSVRYAYAKGRRVFAVE